MCYKKCIHEAVDPLKDDIADLRATGNPCKSELHDIRVRMIAVENRPTSSAAAGSKEIAEMQKMLQKNDPALRRIAFTGWPDSTLPDARMKMIEEFVASKCGRSPITCGNFYKDPYNNRTITSASFAEFSSIDMAQAAMKILKTQRSK